MLLGLSFSRASSQDSWNSRPKHTSGERAWALPPLSSRAPKREGSAFDFAFSGAPPSLSEGGSFFCRVPHPSFLGVRVLPARQPRAYSTVVIPSAEARGIRFFPRANLAPTPPLSSRALKREGSAFDFAFSGAPPSLSEGGSFFCRVPHPSFLRVRFFPCANLAPTPPLSSRALKREGSAFDSCPPGAGFLNIRMQPQLECYEIESPHQADRRRSTC
jgi:hypothetical protein